MFEGRHFLVSFMDNELDQADINLEPLDQRIYIATKRPTTVVFNSAFTNASPYRLGGDTVLSLSISADAEMRLAGITLDASIEITADQPVMVYVLSSRRRSSDGYLAIPTAHWGLDYVVSSMPCDSYRVDPSAEPDSRERFLTSPRSGECMIMAREDNTTIIYTPSTYTSNGGIPGINYNYTLNKGQSLLLKARGAGNGENDLSGTRISADKPVGLLSGHMRSSVPNNFPYPPDADTKDHLIEMLPPMSAWGKRHVSVPFGNTRRGDMIRVYSSAQNTRLRYTDDGIMQTVLLGPPGSFREFAFVNRATYWEADEPVMLVQYMYSPYFVQAREHEVFDPAMVVLSPVEQYVNFIRFSMPFTGNISNYFVSIVAELTALPTLTLNDVLVSDLAPEISSQRIMGTSYYHAIVPVQPRTNYVLRSEGRFSGSIFATGEVDSYALPLGASLLEDEEKDEDKPTISHRETREDCGRVTGEIHESGSGIYDVVIDEDRTRNYEYQFSPIRDTSTFVQFSGEPFDPFQDASLVFRVIDIAGNVTPFEFSYQAPSFNAPTLITFEQSVAEDKLCREYRLQNTGDKPLQIQRIVLTDAPRLQLSELPTFPHTLPPGEELVFDICFFTTNEEPLAERLLLELRCGWRWWTDIAGSVVRPAIEVRGHDFGDVRVGDTVCAYVTLINKGNAALTINELECLSCPGTYFFPDEVLPLDIEPGDSVLVPVCFTPDEEIYYRSDRSALNNFELDNEFYLTGNGIMPLLETADIDWMYRRVGTVNDTTVTLVNRGSAAIELRHADLAANLSFTADTNGLFPYRMEPGDRLTLDLRFVPPARRDYTARMEFTTDWQRQPTAAVALHGIGTLPTIKTFDIDFGTLNLGEQRSRTETVLSAGGNERLSIERIEFADGDISSFAVDEQQYFTLDGLQPDNSHRIEAEFIPQRKGYHEALVRVIHDALPRYERDTAYFRLFGNADRRDTLSTAIERVSFGSVYACLESELPLRIVNTGNTGLRIDSLQIEDNRVLQPSWRDAPSLPLELDSGDTRGYTLRLFPRDSGGESVRITIFANGGAYQETLTIPIEVDKALLTMNPDAALAGAHRVLPGDSLPLLFTGAVKGGLSLPFEFRMTLSYNPSSLKPMSDTGKLLLRDADGREIDLPLTISEVPGTTTITAPEIQRLTLPASWAATIPLRVFLDPEQHPNVDVMIASNDCMDGSDGLVNVDLSPVCANGIRLIRFVAALQTRLAPNPASDEVTINFEADQDENVSLSVQDLLGATVHRQEKIHLKKGKQSYKLKCSNFPSGMYMVTVRAGTALQQHYLIINQ